MSSLALHVEHLGDLTFCVRRLGRVPPVPLPICLPGNAKWEAADNGPSNWIPVTHLRNLGDTLGSCIWSGQF